MIEIEKPNITTENLSVDGTSGTFIVEPLERGYGITLGNSLRRVLLSSLPGVAVTSIKIDGVLHEFTNMPGVKEDVTEIVLNVKSISGTTSWVLCSKICCSIWAQKLGHLIGACRLPRLPQRLRFLCFWQRSIRSKKQPKSNDSTIIWRILC